MKQLLLENRKWIISVKVFIVKHSQNFEEVERKPAFCHFKKKSRMGWSVEKQKGLKNK